MPVQDVPEKDALLLNSSAPIPSTTPAQRITLLLSPPERQRCIATRRAAAGRLQSVQLLAEASLKLKLEVLTDSTANIDVHSQIGSGRVRHLDVRWLWAQEAVQAERFSLKKVGTIENVSDLTTKYQDEEKLQALIRMGGLRFTRGLQHAASAATPLVCESQAIAARS